MITRREVRQRMSVWVTHTIAETSAVSWYHANLMYRGRFYSATAGGRFGTDLLIRRLHEDIRRGIHL